MTRVNGLPPTQEFALQAAYAQKAINSQTNATAVYRGTGRLWKGFDNHVSKRFSMEGNRTYDLL